MVRMRGDIGIGDLFSFVYLYNLHVCRLIFVIIYSDLSLFSLVVKFPPLLLY